MNNYNLEKAYNDLIEESKHSTHRYQKPDDFKSLGKKGLNLTDEVCSVTDRYYTMILRIHHKALVLGSSDSSGKHISLCISILQSVCKESIKSSNVKS